MPLGASEAPRGPSAERPANLERSTVPGGGVPIRAALFDLDGVLIDSLALMRRAHEVASGGGGGGSGPGFELFRELLGRPLTEMAAMLGLPADFCDRYRTERDRHLDLVSMQSGMGTVLASLRRRGLPLGVVTGKDGRAARRVLAMLGHGGTFDVVLGSDEVDEPKPAARHARIAIERLGSARGTPLAPDEVLFVGDSEADMRCGREAGCVLAFARWGYADERALRTAPDLAFDVPADVLAAVTARG